LQSSGGAVGFKAGGFDDREIGINILGDKNIIKRLKFLGEERNGKNQLIE